MRPQPNKNLQIGHCYAAIFAALLLGLLSTALVSPAFAQGVAASVTSSGFGGHSGRAPGIPASVTSQGRIAPQGPHRGGQLVPDQVRTPHPQQSTHRRRIYYPGGAVYAVPYYPYYEEDVPDDQQQATQPPDQYQGGPTIFDRRGPGTDQFASEEQNAASQKQDSAQPASNSPEQLPEPEADQPQTILVFKDGHQLEVSNYAIVGDTLFDLTPGHRRKIALAELDLNATSQQNDDRGIDFHLPTSPRG
jgi:hypothetical protein